MVAVPEIATLKEHTMRTVPETVFDQRQSVLVHHLRTNDNRQIFLVDDVLPGSNDDFAGLLEQFLAAPMRIQRKELFLDSIVFSQPDDVL